MGLLDRIRNLLRGPGARLIDELTPVYGLEKRISSLACIANTAWPYWWEGRVEGRLLAFREEMLLAVYLGEVREGECFHLRRPRRNETLPPAGDLARLDRIVGPEGAALDRAFLISFGSAYDQFLRLPAIREGLPRLSACTEAVGFYFKGVCLSVDARSAGRRDIEHDLKIALSVVKALEDQDSPLIRAAMHGDTAAVKQLIAQGADVNSKGVQLWTALMHASKNGHEEAAGALLQAGADAAARGVYGETALIAAAESGQVGMVRLLLEQYEADDEELEDALVFAAFEGKDDVVRSLLEWGVPAAARLHGGRKFAPGITALMNAACRGHLETARLLAANGADLFAKDENGRTAASMARIAGHTEVADLLEDLEAQRASDKA